MCRIADFVVDDAGFEGLCSVCITETTSPLLRSPITWLMQAKAAYSELERELKRTQDLLQSAQLLGRDKDTKLRAAQGELLAQVAAVSSSLMRKRG